MYEELKKNDELWDLYTRKEEYNTIYYDKYNRYPFYLSKNRNIFKPIVSEFLIKKGLKFYYPDNKKFAVCLTHDIDYIYPAKKKALFESLKSIIKLKILNSINNLASIFDRKLNPWWNIKDIINLEKKYNAKSSFYFLVLDQVSLDFHYDLKDLEIDLGFILDNNFEIGLQGNHKSYQSFKEIKDMKIKLEKYIDKKIIGYRNHYLKFKIPDTWEFLSDAGFKYDTTLGYPDCVGFRNGMCHPFKPYNLKTNKKIDIFEIPLIIMDKTLFKYMKLDYYKAWNVTKLLIDVVEKNNGVITILWHNNFFNDKNFKFYEKILKYCFKKKAWMTSASEISDFWSKL